MTPDVTRTHFSLFGLPVGYAVDEGRLERAYRDLQMRVHPDKYASASDAEKRVAMQWAAQANEAYRTLRDPVERARYLLQLKGYDTAEETHTSMPPDFLMQQMEWREAVAQARKARDAKALGDLHGEIRAARDDMLGFLGRALDADANYDAACSLVRKLRFLDKLDVEIDESLEH
jgi:molecular chaperone HscB